MAAALPPGAYAVSVRAAGADRRTPPALSARVDVPAGAARTVSLSGYFADLALQTLSDDVSAPPPGSARVRVVAAAGQLPALDVSVRGGDALATGLPFGAAGEPRTLPAGALTLTVGGAGGTATEVPVSVAAGSVVTLLVLDGPDGSLAVRPVLDAAGPAVVPSGAVEAGTGPGTWPVVPLAGAALAACAAAGHRGRLLMAVLALSTTLCAPAPVSPRPVPAPASTAGSALPVGPVAVAGRPAAPARLLVPAAGIDAAVTAAGLDSAGALVPPADPALAGWHPGGPVPGGTGPAVIAGHVDWAGAPGVFARLSGLAPGAQVTVARADGSTVGFTVTRVERWAKQEFPTAEVYAPATGAELRLITCGGSFDPARGSYTDNVVVFAQVT